MESEDFNCDIPECPHLRPCVSSEDFDDINLEENFQLSEIETETQATKNLQEEFTQEETQPISKWKRSFHEVCATSKPSFQYYMERPEKRPVKKIHR